MTDSDQIAAILGRAAEGPDLTARVYERLFARHPEMEALFVRDTNGAVRGEMLAKVWEVLLDVADRREWAARMIQCEVVTHEGYDVPREVFGVFFRVVMECVREALPDWSEADAAAFERLLAVIDRFVRNPDQAIAPAFA